jgi:RNA polymerase sigma factor (TIGR02999 family)
MNDVTKLLCSINQGDSASASELLPLVYDELRKLAKARLTQEKPGQTLQATALVHEAYLRLVKGDESQHWDTRGHFFAAAAEAMRRILVDQARRKTSVKHGGEHNRLPLGEVDLESEHDAEELLALDEALSDLAGANADAANLVHLRHFAGLTMDQAAELLSISPRSAYHLWSYARAWLKQRMQTES